MGSTGAGRDDGRQLHRSLLCFPLGMAFAAASDLLTMTISNQLTLGLVAAFVVARPASRHGSARPSACISPPAAPSSPSPSSASPSAGSAAATPSSPRSPPSGSAGSDALEFIVLASHLRRRPDLVMLSFRRRSCPPSSFVSPGFSGCTTKGRACRMGSRSPPPDWPSIRTRSGCRWRSASRPPAAGDRSPAPATGASDRSSTARFRRRPGVRKASLINEFSRLVNHKYTIAGRHCREVGPDRPS